jgi:aromatic ring-opening dioxygenase LigB subunit
MGLDAGVVAGWIAPHGVVPDMPEERLRKAANTDTAMREAAERFVAQRPDTVIMTTPHGFRSPTVHTVSLCKRYFADLRTWYPWNDNKMAIEGDSGLAEVILDECRRAGHPAHGAIYGATSEPVYPMDWSLTSPLVYLQAAGYKGPIVAVTFTGGEFNQEWQFGQFLGKACASSGRRVGIIASSDLSHVHSDEGPYGNDPVATEFDRVIREAVESDDFASLRNLDPAWVQRAAQDGLRSILILGGAIEHRGLRPEVLAYDVLVYFGMLTATYMPD